MSIGDLELHTWSMDQRIVETSQLVYPPFGRGPLPKRARARRPTQASEIAAWPRLCHCALQALGRALPVGVGVDT